MSIHARLLLWPALLVLSCPLPSVGAPGQAVPLDSLTAFKPAATGWQLASDLAGNPRLDTALTILPGTGLIVAGPATAEPLVTATSYGDGELELDFLLAAGATPTVFLQGRYALHLGNGAAGTNPPPPVSAGRAPGLWQQLRVEFRAPVFDARGNKTAPARLTRVTLNGFILHENITLAAPSAGAPYADEAPRGPLALTAAPGQIAIRKLAFHPLATPAPAPSDASATKSAGKDAAKAKKAAAKTAAPLVPIPVEVTDRIIVQRGFVPFAPSKRLYAVSVGTPAGVHFAYDLETSALLRVWRGRFLDVSEMWEGRSANQWAKTTGPDLTLSALPLVARAPGTPWPDQPDALTKSLGYTTEPNGQPIFVSQFAGLTIRDRLAPATDARGLTRTLTFSGPLPAEPALILLAVGACITVQPDGRGYIIGDREYYLDAPAAATAAWQILSRGNHQMLVVPLSADLLARPLTYTLAW